MIDITNWAVLWAPPANSIHHDPRPLSDAELATLLTTENKDYPALDKTLTYFAYPGVATGYVRENNDGTFQGTGILAPCAHPIRVKAKTYEALEWAFSAALPVKCAYCLKEIELYGAD